MAWAEGKKMSHGVRAFQGDRETPARGGGSDCRAAVLSHSREWDSSVLHLTLLSFNVLHEAKMSYDLFGGHSKAVGHI